jgi:hypothetical protein
VRDVDFWIDRSTDEAVLLFTRNCRGRRFREPGLGGNGFEGQSCDEDEESEQKYN